MVSETSTRHALEALPRSARRVMNHAHHVRRTLCTALIMLGVALGGGLFAAPIARANPPDTFGLGARSTALAGAVTADVEDFSAGYYNPAGLARSGRMRLELGYFLARPELRLGGRDNEVDDVRGIVGGLVVPGKVAGTTFAFGLSLHLPDERISRTRSIPLTQARWELYDNRPHRLFLGVNLAWKPFDWLSIGGGIGFMSTSETRLEVVGEIPAIGAATRSRLEHALRTDLLSVRYPQAGIQVTPNDSLSFGLAYRGEFQLGLALDANVSADITLGALALPIYFQILTASINAFLPQQLSFGAAWKPVRTLRIGLDLTWVDWSAYRAPVGTTDVRLDLTVPPAFAMFVSQPGPISGSRPVPANFTDRFVPRIGVEWLAVETSNLDLRLRGGYYYEFSPVPMQSGLSNFVDTDRHIFSAGAGIALHDLGKGLPGELLFDAYFQSSYMVPRTMTKASLLDPTGSYLAEGVIWAAGATTGVTFE